MKISTKLKQVIRKSGFPVYKLAEKVGLSQSQLSLFLNDNDDAHRDLRLEASVDHLCEFLGLELIEARKPKAQPPKRATGQLVRCDNCKHAWTTRAKRPRCSKCRKLIPAKSNRSAKKKKRT